jgi:hypothetical protein
VPAAADYLEAEAQDARKWAGCYRTRPGHSQFTSNAAESSVHWVSDELRESSAVELLYGVVKKIMVARAKARQEAVARAARGCVYTKHAMESFECERREALHYTVSPCSATVYFAKRDGVEHRVDMEHEACTCTVPQQHLHACRHMIAVKSYKKETMGFPSTTLFHDG